MKTSIEGRDRLALRLAAVTHRARPGVVRRCMAVLAVADGTPIARVARQLGVSRPTVYHWVRTFDRGGVGALAALRPAPR